MNRPPRARILMFCWVLMISCGVVAAQQIGTSNATPVEVQQFLKSVDEGSPSFRMLYRARKEIYQSHDLRTGLRDLVRKSNGFGLRLAVNFWGQCHQVQKGALTSSDIELLVDASRRTDFYAGITPEQKSKYSIPCRSTLTLPSSILAANQVDPNLLLPYFQESSPMARRMAIHSVGSILRGQSELENDDIVEHLVNARNDPDSSVREAVAKAFQFVSVSNDSDVVLSLRNMLDDPDSAVRQAAIIAVRPHGKHLSAEHVGYLAKLFFQPKMPQSHLSYSLGMVAQSGDREVCDAIIDSFYPLYKGTRYEKYTRSGQVRALSKAAVHASPERMLRVFETICKESRSSNAYDHGNALRYATELATAISPEKLALLQEQAKELPGHAKVMKAMLAARNRAKQPKTDSP